MSYGEEEDVYLGRPVMSNHEAPELFAHHQGDRNGGRDSHILKVLEVALVCASQR